MEAIKCDRCGKFQQILLKFSNKLPSIDVSNTLKDICSDCYLDYKEWWEQGKHIGKN